MSTFNVLVKGRNIDTYYHDGKTYVEGRKGSKYTLQFYNNSSVRKKIVISVDGLNIMTGDSDWQRGYVVDPWQTVEIPGWRKDSNKVNDFVFSLLKGSYNYQNDNGDARNIGVIGCLVFSEKVKTYWNALYQYKPDLWPYYEKYTLTGGNWNTFDDGHVTLNNSSGPISANYLQAKATNDISNRPRGFAGSASASATPEVKTMAQNSIGTGYGKESDFKTHTVYAEFNDAASETFEIYYDERQGLVSRGVIAPKARPYKGPQAFPGYNPDGCPPPRRRYRHRKSHSWVNWP